MGWLPSRTCGSPQVRVNERADRLTHDLAIDASGFGQPDPIAAGLARPPRRGLRGDPPWVAARGGPVAAALVAVLARSGQRRGARAIPRDRSPPDLTVAPWA